MRGKHLIEEKGHPKCYCGQFLLMAPCLAPQEKILIFRHLDCQKTGSPRFIYELYSPMNCRIIYQYYIVSHFKVATAKSSTNSRSMLLCARWVMCAQEAILFYNTEILRFSYQHTIPKTALRHTFTSSHLMHLTTRKLLLYISTSSLETFEIIITTSRC